MRIPTNSDRVAIVGMTGSGKTVAGVHLLSLMVQPKSRWIILDFKYDELIGDIRQAEEIGLSHVPKSKGLYVVHPSPNDTDNVEDFLWKIWEKENTGIFIDEGYMLQRSKAFQALLTQGRSKKIPIITLSQRPAWLTRFVWSEANFHQAFHLNMADDKKSVQEFIPGYRKDLELPNYHSFWHDVAKRNLVIARPAPDKETILNTFEAKLGRRLIAI